jgi:hypothetical protein
MAWFFKVTYYDGVPCAEQWVGPFDDEAAALTRQGEMEANQNGVLQRTDTFTVPADIADPRPSPVIMIVSDADGVDWMVHEDGTRNLKPV